MTVDQMKENMATLKEIFTPILQPPSDDLTPESLIREGVFALSTCEAKGDEKGKKNSYGSFVQGEKTILLNMLICVGAEQPNIGRVIMMAGEALQEPLPDETPTEYATRMFKMLIS